MNRIRITGSGIHGAPVSNENPNGEYPVGYEFDTDAYLPAGWIGRAEVISEGAKKGSTFVAGSGEPGPLDGSVEDLSAYLANVSDLNEVQALIDAETAGKSRKGALTALEARRDELLAA